MSALLETVRIEKALEIARRISRLYSLSWRGYLRALDYELHLQGFDR